MVPVGRGHDKVNQALTLRDERLGEKRQHAQLRGPDAFMERASSSMDNRASAQAL